MSHIAFHPAPGLGDLLPGWHSVPQNPITAGESAVRYTPRIGELVAAYFSLPANPLVQHGMGGCGCQSRAADGMGELDLSSAWETVTASASGVIDSAKSINPWVLGGGLALVAILLFRPSGSEYRQAMSAAREKYRGEVSRVKARYPRVAGRARRAAGAF